MRLCLVALIRDKKGAVCAGDIFFIVFVSQFLREHLPHDAPRTLELGCVSPPPLSSQLLINLSVDAS
jgi:hypothetical protein